MAFKANSKAVFSIIGVMIILAATGFLSSSLANSSSNPGCVGQGACVLYFYANWCEACEQMTPVVSGLEQEYGGRIRIVRVNTDRTQGRKLARELGVIGQPTFVLFDASGQEVRRLMGAQTGATLQREFERCLSCGDGGMSAWLYWG